MSDQLTPEDAAAAAIRSRIEALNAALAALVEPAAERWAHIKEACDMLSSTTLADLVYAAILCRDIFGSAGIAEAVA